MIRAALALAAVAIVLPASAGQVRTYLEGDRYCPQGIPADARPLDGDGAIARARPMLPDRFCGPSAAVDGCDADAEFVGETFRVYFHQYKVRDGKHDWSRLLHTYVILDRVGNCLAHIPGTEVFDNMF